MPGPTTPAQALQWVREALAARRYLIDPHFRDQCEKRKMTFLDAKKVIETATACSSYKPDRPPRTASGTSWRVTGEDTEGTETRLGVETFEDHLGKRMILITIM
jgi:hypothetical protein